MAFTKLKTVALGLSAVFAANQAQAMEVGQCAPAAQMSAALKAEGQKSLITANRVTEDANYTPLNMVTSNSEGNGYLLEGDKAFGQPSTKFCVMLKMSSMALFDASRPGVNPATLIGGKHDKSTMAAEKHGTRPMIQGHVSGTVVTIYGNMSDRTGSMHFTEAASANVVMQAVFGEITYTQTAVDTLRKPVQTASLRP